MAIGKLLKITRIFSRNCIRENTRTFKPHYEFEGLWRTVAIRCCCHSSHTQPIHGEVTVTYSLGLPVLTVPLPSRQEKCRFTLRPVSSTVGDLVRDVTAEDHGIDRLTLYTPGRVRIAASTSIGSLLQHDFHLVVNDRVYLVSPPQQGRLTSEEVQSLDHVRCQVARIYEVLNVEEYQVNQERRILASLEQLRSEIEPFEKKKSEVMEAARRRTTALSWCGLGLMGVQFGILARLTWWEYSWDIMEPVTYFITYGTSMICYAYFVLTRQEYVLPDVYDRHSLSTFHRHATKAGLDVDRYNRLRDAIAQCEYDLRRLRDPLQAHLPIRELPPTSSKSDT